jgi:hypothetical protein
MWILVLILYEHLIYGSKMLVTSIYFILVLPIVYRIRKLKFAVKAQRKGC